MSSAIQSQNVQAAVGRIGARPISNDQQLQLNLQTKGRLTTVAEFANIVIRTNPDGSVLRLGDGKTAIILWFSVLFAYLFLVALYESGTIPVPVLLSVAVGILGSVAAIV